MEPKVKEAIVSIAKKNGIEPAALLAIKQVETGKGSGMLPDGRPEILFEGHVFYKYYNKKFPNTNAAKLKLEHPSIYYPNWTKKYYKGGSAEHLRLDEACKLDRESALLSASWGIGQIMGFNYKSCNCSSIQDFVNKQYSSLESQLQLWVNFLKNNGYIPLLNSHKWRSITIKYNGTGQIDDYVKKLTIAYNNYKKIN